MKSFSLFAAVLLLLGGTFAAGDAEAKRLGSGKSVGMQRQATVPDKAPTTAPTSAATPATASAAAPGAAAGGAAAAAPRSSWMGPVAGLAAGLGLAALASHFGFGEELASMLLIGLLVVAVLAVVGFVMRRRAAAQAGSGFDRMQYAAAGAQAGAAQAGGSAFERVMPASGGAGAAAAMPAAPVAARNIPADFDAAGFARNAKVNFIRLQAAHDAGNLDDIRAFTTPEVFAEIRMDIADRGAATQETDVVQIDAEVLEVAEEDSRYVVSVRFQGLVRDSGAASPEPVDEIWHMTKPRDGSSGWVIAGIQQVQ